MDGANVLAEYIYNGKGQRAPTCYFCFKEAYLQSE
ncbi:hypothetical protein BMS3Abin10_01153 [bacterium BMS3Abin10]|nr:hypothetical protein BMS3Abin10_01153 [bacterium BMS3Abin10]GBE38100.1 hypothetical protein BMS3Bbin08_00702 [bacterium BMS3Bbin08]